MKNLNLTPFLYLFACIFTLSTLLTSCKKDDDSEGTLHEKIIIGTWNRKGSTTDKYATYTFNEDKTFSRSSKGDESLPFLSEELILKGVYEIIPEKESLKFTQVTINGLPLITELEYKYELKTAEESDSGKEELILTSVLEGKEENGVIPRYEIVEIYHRDTE